MTEGFHVPRCHCGHLLGEHQSNRAPLLVTPQRYGVCLVEGCGCQRFVDDREEPDHAAASTKRYRKKGRP